MRRLYRREEKRELDTWDFLSFEEEKKKEPKNKQKQTNKHT